MTVKTINSTRTAGIAAPTAPKAVRRAVFLDRDGVLNQAVVRDGRPYPPQSPEQVKVIDDATEALRRLREAGFLLIAVTNQPDVARGTQRREVVEAINGHLRLALGLDDIRTNFDDGESLTRKPNPGMLLEAAEQWGISLVDSFMVGDRWKDIEAGRRAGCRTIFINRNYSEAFEADPADATVPSVCAAADWILSQAPPKSAMAKSPVSHEIPKVTVTAAQRNVRMLKALKVKIFADGADRAGILEMHANPLIQGFTTNPTLMRKAGVSDYAAFARDILKVVPDRPISFEVFSDDFEEMRRQARQIAAWGPNVYVKIPVTNTLGHSSAALVADLARDGVKLNVTAIFTLEQTLEMTQALRGGAPAVVSVFAGRIADAGVDPVPHMAACRQIVNLASNVELLWASPRELLNIIHADQVGCDIITVTNDVLKKLSNIGKDLGEFSLDTVKMFRTDAVKAGFSL